MSIRYILIASASASIIFMGAYFVAVNFINRKVEKRSVDIRNTFIYEVNPPFRSKFGSLNVLLFASLVCTLVGVILFASKYLETMPIVLAVISTVLMFCLGSLPFVNIKYLKEHLYLDLGAIILYALACAFELYLSASIAKIYDFSRVGLIIAIVVSAILFLVSLFFIFNPSLFNLRNQANENGEYERAKFIPLVFSEWVILFSSSLLLIPLLIITLELTKI